MSQVMTRLQAFIIVAVLAAGLSISEKMRRLIRGLTQTSIGQVAYAVEASAYQIIK